MPKFTEEQIQAYEKEGNVIVSAGAGSGKTEVLSERVLYFIKEKGYHINEFLILTFTKLAAGEMKDRIRQKLSKNNLSDKDYVDVADITTFDGFSNSLVKKYHSILGLDENFTIVDSNITMVLKKRYIEAEIERLFELHDQRIESFAKTYLFKNYDILTKVIIALLRQGELAFDKEAFYDSFVKEHYENKSKIDELYQIIYRDFLLKTQEMESLLDMVPDVFTKSGESILGYYQNYFNSLSSSSSWNDFLDIVLDYKGPSIPKNIEIDEEDKKSFSEFKAKVNKDLNKPCKDVPIRKDVEEAFATNKPYLEMIVEIARSVDSKLNAYKFDHQAFEFSDIGKLAISLVRDHQEIQDELRNRFRMIMIDEYQDTNDIQEIFVSYIQNNNVYSVGDIKQAIYGFRDARCDIFQNKYNLYKKDSSKGTPIDLNKNFRSREEVLKDINFIFQNMMSEEMGGANYKKDHIIEYGNKAYKDEENPNQSNFSEVYTYQGDKVDVEHEIRIIAQDIIEKINSGYQVCQFGKDKGSLRPCEFKDFAIILDRGSSFEDYVRIFNEYHIPIYMEKDENLIDNPLTKLFQNIVLILKYLDNHIALDDDFKLAYVSLVRSFIYSYSDEQIYQLVKEDRIMEDEPYLELKSLIATYNDASSYLKLEKVIEKLDVYNKLTRIGDIERNNSILNLFLSNFKDMERFDYSYDDFVSYLDSLNEYKLKLNLTSKGTSLNSVRIINIHKSKGLQFSIIYFPGLKKEFNEADVEGDMGVSKKFGIYLQGDKSLIKMAYKIDYRNEMISEKIRLFYVALTRTKEKMIFVLPKSEDYREVFINRSKHFYDMFYPYTSHFKNIDKTKLKEVSLNIEEQEVPTQKVTLEEMNFDFSRTPKLLRASKEASFSVDEGALNLGNELHFIMEVLDFKHPDYSFIHNPFYRKKAEAFLKSTPLEDINEAKIYKEYEFVDSINKTNGIIDLYIEKKDEVLIIDYKTKNIDDPKYEDQLKVYYDFITQKYSKKVRTFLYSLIDEKFKEVTF